MEYVNFGNTGLQVSRICLGCMTYGSPATGKILPGRQPWALGEADSAPFFRQALDLGINFWDTANVYSGGDSEIVIGRFLRQNNIRRESMVIATKVCSPMREEPNGRGLSRKAILFELDESLKRLQTDYIDLYQIHGNDSVTPLEETLRALDALVTQGKVRYIGCSNWQAWKISKALTISGFRNLARFDTLQAYYSIAGRDLEREIVPLLESEKTGLLVWSPLAGGLLSGKFSRENQKPEGSRRSEFDFPLVDKERTWKILDVMTPLAKAHDCSPARIALAWLLSKPVVTSVIIGAKRLDQLQDNLAAVDLKLTIDEIKQLDEVSALPPEYPGWMLAVQNANRLKPVPRA